jgi:hypothetical protein
LLLDGTFTVLNCASFIALVDGHKNKKALFTSYGFEFAGPE